MCNQNDKTKEEIKTKFKYLDQFPAPVQKKALENILDIRKFEIEMYWKRATYFWAFIGAVFVGYFAFTGNPKPTDLDRKQFILITLGVLFSLCWYLVNRGSKFWQQNWETHLDVMEDGLIGPLYKTTIPKGYDKGKWYHLNGPYRFSVSKINILLSLFILIIWVVIDVSFIYGNSYQFFPGLHWHLSRKDLCLFLQPGWWNLYTILLLVQIVSVVFLFCCGKTNMSPTCIDFEQREVKDKKDCK